MIIPRWLPTISKVSTLVKRMPELMESTLSSYLLIAQISFVVMGRKCPSTT